MNIQKNIPKKVIVIIRPFLINYLVLVRYKIDILEKEIIENNIFEKKDIHENVFSWYIFMDIYYTFI